MCRAGPRDVIIRRSEPPASRGPSDRAMGATLPREHVSLSQSLLERVTVNRATPVLLRGKADQEGPDLITTSKEAEDLKHLSRMDSGGWIAD